MFLQRFKPAQWNDSPYPRKPIMLGKVQQALRNVNTPEIKQHRKKQIFFTQRRYLIQNTHKIVGNTHRKRNHFSHQLSRQSNPEVKAFSKEKQHSQNKNGKKTSKNWFRHKVWKSTDITSIMKIYEQKLNEDYQQQCLPEPALKIEPYHEKQQKYNDSQTKQREQIKQQWLMFQSSPLQGDLYKYHQKMPITNIQFNRYEQTNNNMHSQRIASRDHRRQQRKMVSTSRVAQKRPNTTKVVKRNRLFSDDNILEPW